MKKWRTKYWDLAENCEVSAQNDDIMQKIMQPPHNMKKLLLKYWPHKMMISGRMQSLCKILKLFAKLWSHCTKWWYNAENDRISAQNEKVACKILRLWGKLCSHCTKWWHHAENNAITKQNDDSMQKMMQVAKKNEKFARKIFRLCGKLCSQRTK